MKFEETPIDLRHGDVASLAFKLWEARGRPFGSPDVDWYRAEQILKNASEKSQALRLWSLDPEPYEGPSQQT